jgi:hypothetical protein
MMCCENGRQAAYANDRVTYDKMRRAELAQATKLIQFVEIVVRQPTSNMPPPGESAKKEKEDSVAAKKPGKKSLIEVTTKKPKVADINADVNKWVAAYKPSAEYQPSLSEQQVMMAQSHSSSGRTTTTTAHVAATAAPSQQQMAGQVTGRTTAAFTPIKAPATSTTTTTATKKGVNDVLSTPAKSNSYFGLPKE